MDGEARPGDDGSYDLDHTTGGLVAGYDLALANGAVVGAALSYAHSTLDLGAVDRDGTIDSYRVAACASTELRRAAICGLVGYALHDNETRRDIAIGGFHRTAKGNYRGHELAAAAEAGYQMGVGSVAVEPVAGLAYTRLSDEGYDETGGGGAGLAVDSRVTQSLRSTIGARATLDRNGKSA